MVLGIFVVLTNELFFMNPLSGHGPELFTVDGWEASWELCSLWDFCQVPPEGPWQPSFLSKHTSCLLPLLSTCIHKFDFFQAHREASRHKTTEWFILGSVTVCLYFPRFWFPVWKFKILWHVSINKFSSDTREKARPHVRKSAFKILLVLGWMRAQRCVSCLP